VGYEEVQTDIKGLWIAGIPIWTVTYLFTFLVTTTVDPNDEELVVFSAIPLIGPWMMLGTGKVAAGAPVGFTVLSGILQTAGLAMIVVGKTVQTTKKVPLYALGDDPDAPLLSLTPGPVGPGAFGLNLTLTRF
jgi:hypothetical protein